MALLWIDGFDAYGTSGSAPSPAGILSRKYDFIGGTETSMAIRDGRVGGYAFDCFWSTNSIGSGAITTEDTVVAGFAVNFSSFNWPYPTYSYPFFALYDGTTSGITLYYTATGEIAICMGGTLLATSSGVGLSLGNWTYIELKIKCNDSTGTYELHADGVSVCSGTGVDTKAGSHNYYDSFRFIGIAVAYDDFYFLDISGSTNNDFLGPRRVLTLFPDSVGDLNEWTGSGGADHYTYVNENPVDDDSTYVESSTSNQEELWNYDDPPPTLGLINGVQVNTDCRVTDVTSMTIKTQIKSDTTDSSDAGQLVSVTNYKTLRRVAELDPHTSTAWNSTTVSAAQFGIKVV